MKDKIENLIQTWNDKNGENNTGYSDDKLVEIATNCVSLSETWFDNVRDKNKSFKLCLYNRDGDLSETLHGINRDNLPITIMKTIVNNSINYSKLELCTFKYEDGENKTESVGEMFIS